MGLVIVFGLAAVALIVAAEADALWAAAEVVSLTAQLVTVASYIVLLPVTVRRLHDTNRSGWWVLLLLVPAGAIVLLIFVLFGSDPGPNRYGPGPAASTTR